MFTAQYYTWKKKRFENAGAVFQRKDDKRGREIKRPRQELRRKDRANRETTAGNSDLKKGMGYRGSPSRSGGASVGNRGRSRADEEKEWFKSE